MFVDIGKLGNLGDKLQYNFILFIFLYYDIFPFILYLIDLLIYLFT